MKFNHNKCIILSDAHLTLFLQLTVYAVLGKLFGSFLQTLVSFMFIIYFNSLLVIFTQQG